MGAMLKNFQDGDEVFVTFVSVDGSVRRPAAVRADVKQSTVFSAEHDLINDGSDVSRVWFVESVHRTRAEAHAHVAIALRSIAADVIAEAIKHEEAVAKANVGEAVPS